MRADVKASEAEEKRKMRMEEVINRKKLKAGGAKKKEAPVRVLDARDAMLSELRSKNEARTPYKSRCCRKESFSGETIRGRQRRNKLQMD